MQVYKDYSTKNESFLKVATQLKEKGIKNYDFMLTLLDKDLQDVIVKKAWESYQRNVESEQEDNGNV